MTSKCIIVRIQENRQKTENSILCCLRCAILCWNSFFRKYFKQCLDVIDYPESVVWQAICQLEMRIIKQVTNFFAMPKNVIYELWKQFRTTGDIYNRSGKDRLR